MREPHAIQRLLTLRQFPGLGDAELTELATVARNVTEHGFAAGELVARAGTPVPAIHLVLEGRLATLDGRHAWSARQLFGGFEVIAGRAAAADVRAEVPTRTLRLRAADYVDLLEDNYGLLSAARRLLARRLLALGRTGFRASPVVPDRGGVQPLGLVERLVVLRRYAPLAKGRIQALAALAQASEEVRIPARTSIVTRGAPADDLRLVLDGALRTPRGVLVAGMALGGLEALAELPHAESVETVTAVRALRVPSAALFDVMEDHTDFALAVVARLANEMLDAHVPPVDEDVN